MAWNETWQRLKWSLTSEKKRQKLLEDTCNLLRFWPETNGLLELAKAENIPILFNAELIGQETDGFFFHNRKSGERRIELKPFADPRDLMIVLVHELRHLWQEKELGLTPETAGLSEKDAMTALIYARVKEADAFAFTNLMITRLNHAQEDFIAQQEFAKQLQGAAPQLTDAQQEQVDDFLADRIAARIADEKKFMDANFVKQLHGLDSYDRIAVSDYHRRYLDPLLPLAHLTAKDGPVVDIAALRKILRTGTMASMPLYLDAPDDKGFAEIVLKEVAAPVVEAARLMTAFESAAARLPKTEADRQRQDIDAAVRKAVALPPPS